jgi:hypothetical protein
LILVVNPSVPAKNLKEFIAWAKTQDGANYASPGAGSPHHLTTEMFRESVATKWRDFLTTYALVPNPHPVMLAWTEFAKLLEPEFAAKASELAQRLARHQGVAGETRIVGRIPHDEGRRLLENRMGAKGHAAIGLFTLETVGAFEPLPIAIHEGNGAH